MIGLGKKGEERRGVGGNVLSCFCCFFVAFVFCWCFLLPVFFLLLFFFSDALLGSSLGSSYLSLTATTCTTGE